MKIFLLTQNTNINKTLKKDWKNSIKNKLPIYTKLFKNQLLVHWRNRSIIINSPQLPTNPQKPPWPKIQYETWNDYVTVVQKKMVALWAKLEFTCIWYCNGSRKSMCEKSSDVGNNLLGWVLNPKDWAADFV